MYIFYKCQITCLYYTLAILILHNIIHRNLLMPAIRDVEHIGIGKEEEDEAEAQEEDEANNEEASAIEV